MQKFVEIECKVWRWKDLLRMRREQSRESKQPPQTTLFPLRDDSRPVSQLTPDGRYQEPLLFEEK